MKKTFTQLACFFLIGGGISFGQAAATTPALTLASDGALIAVVPQTPNNSTYVEVPGVVSLSGKFVNKGASTITELVIKYTDGTTTWSDSRTGLSIAPSEVLEFTHSTPYQVIANGKVRLTMSVEVPDDGNKDNNVSTVTITGVPFTPVHRVTNEEGTGTWCGWCPRGKVFMDSCEKVHPSSVLIAVHNNDPMTNSVYDAGMGTILQGDPSILTDRRWLIDPADIFQAYDLVINRFGDADLAVKCNYNSGTRLATVDVGAHFAIDTTGDWRIALVFTEDGVTGTTSQYAQQNYYAPGQQGAGTVMGGFENMSDPVPASKMIYDHVARTILGGFLGQKGSLPTTIVSNSTYNYTFTYTIPSYYNPAKMNCYALLMCASDTTIRNANGGALSLLSAINEEANGVVFNLFPNPTSGMVNLSMVLQSEGAVSLNVYDLLGQTVLTRNLGEKGAGPYDMNFNMESLPAGIYNCTLATKSGTASKKFIKE